MKSSFTLSKLILLASIIMVLQGCATTNEAIGRFTSFNSLDINEDDLISAREAKQLAALSKNFNRFDTDGNQNISKLEFKAASTRLAPLNFRHIDFNNDGVLSRREVSGIRPTLKEAFDRVDSDNDNNISLAEYNAATNNMLLGMNFTDVDRDGDGVIDTSEAKVNPTLYYEFRAIDINEDNLISKAEFKWAQEL